MQGKPTVIKFFAPVIKEMKIDAENIARVIAANTGKTVQEVTNSMLARTMLNPEEAKAWGLVHEIKAELFEIGSEVVSIQYRRPQTEDNPCGSWREEKSQSRMGVRRFARGFAVSEK
jgi:hypothetical protein